MKSSFLMQELSITIQNSVLPSVCSQGEESEAPMSFSSYANDWQRPSEASKSLARYTNDWQRPGPDSAFGIELNEEPSIVEASQSRSKRSVACFASVRERVLVSVFVCVCFWS